MFLLILVCLVLLHNGGICNGCITKLDDFMTMSLRLFFDAAVAKSTGFVAATFAYGGVKLVKNK